MDKTSPEEDAVPVAAPSKPSRRWVYLFGLLTMLTFIVATHTVGPIANITSQSIHALTGLTTTTTQAREALQGLRDQAAKDAQRLQRLTHENTVMRTAQAPQTTHIHDLETANAILLEQIVSQLSLLSDIREAYLRSTRRNLRNTAQQAQMVAQTLAAAKRIQTRTAKTAAVNLGSILGEAIPFWGIAAIVGTTTYELKESCDTMNDLYALQVSIDPNTTIPAARNEVCGMQVPDQKKFGKR